MQSLFTHWNFLMNSSQIAYKNSAISFECMHEWWKSCFNQFRNQHFHHSFDIIAAILFDIHLWIVIFFYSFRIWLMLDKEFSYLRISVLSRQFSQSKSDPRSDCIEIVEFPWQLIQPLQVGKHSCWSIFDLI